MEKARLQAEQANTEERQKYEAELSQKLTEAEAKNQRALSRDQVTRKGSVHIISNIGFFEGGSLKDRHDPSSGPAGPDQITQRCLGSFEFNVHAMISSDAAPALEGLLHREFDDLRINKLNYRKVFFHLPLERLRHFLIPKGVEASLTMMARGS